MYAFYAFWPLWMAISCIADTTNRPKASDLFDFDPDSCLVRRAGFNFDKWFDDVIEATDACQQTFEMLLDRRSGLDLNERSTRNQARNVNPA